MRLANNYTASTINVGAIVVVRELWLWTLNSLSGAVGGEAAVATGIAITFKSGEKEAAGMLSVQAMEVSFRIISKILQEVLH